MNEPYLLRTLTQHKRKGRGDTQRERRKEKEKEERRKKETTTKGRKGKPCTMTSMKNAFFSLIVQYCLLVLRLWFEGWVVMTVLVENPKRLFQDAPSQFAYLGITMKSCTDRLP